MNTHIDFLSSVHQAIPGSSRPTCDCRGLCGLAQVQINLGAGQAAGGH